MNKIYSLLLGGALALFGSGIAQAAYSVPYTSPVALKDALEEGWIVIDSNNDGKTWQSFSDDATTPLGGTGYAARIQYNLSLPSDDWLISPAIHLEAGKEYKVLYYLKTYSGGTQKMNVYASKSTNPVEIVNTTPIQEYQGNLSSYAQQYSSVINPSEDGDYHIAFHDISSANQWYVYVTMVSVLENSFTPAGVSNLIAERNPDRTQISVNLSWTLPTKSMLGDAFTADQTIEKVNIYRDGSETPIATLTGPVTTYTDDSSKGLTSGVHTYEVEVEVAGIKSPKIKAETKYVGPITPATVPYTWEISDETAFEDWTVLKGEGSQNTGNWTVKNSYGEVYASYSCQQNKAEEDYLISPPFDITKPGYYKVTVYGRASNPDYSHKIAVKYGTAPTIAAMTGTACEKIEYVTGNKEYSYIVKIDNAGTYYFAYVAENPTPNYGITIYAYSMGLEESEKTPAKVENLKATPGADEALSVTLSWTCPAKSTNGEDLASSEYSIQVYKGGTLLTTLPGGTTTYTDTAIETPAVYTYTVRTIATGGSYADDVTITSPWVGPHLVDLPYATQFGTNDTTRAIWDIIDNNEDGKTWTYYNNSQYRCLQSDVTDDNGNNFYDDYFLTPHFDLTPGYYEFKFMPLGGTTSKPMIHEVGMVKAGTFVAGRTELMQPKQYESKYVSEYFAEVVSYIVKIEEAGRYQMVFAATGYKPFAGMSGSDAFYYAYGVCQFSAASYPVLPGLAEDLTVTPDANQALKAVISWTNPTTTNIDDLALDAITKAVIIRDGEAVAEVTTGLVPGQTSTFTDTEATGLTPGKHTYSVEIHTADGKSETAAPSVKSEWIGGGMYAPVQFNADGSNDKVPFSEWTFIDADNNFKSGYDGWSVPSSIAMKVDETNTNNSYDDWAISQPVNFKSNGVYKLTIHNYIGRSYMEYAPYSFDIYTGSGTETENYVKLATLTNDNADSTQTNGVESVFYFCGPDADEAAKADVPDGETVYTIVPGDRSIAFHATQKGGIFIDWANIDVLYEPEPAFEPKATFNYEPGATMAYITWNLDEEVTIWPGNSNYRTITFTSGDDVIEVPFKGMGGPGSWKEYYANDNYIGAEINLWSLPLTAGKTYTVNILEGCFEFDGDDIDPTSPAQTLEFAFAQFDINFMDAATVTQTMEGRVSTLVPIQLTWGQEVQISPNQYSAIIKNITDNTQTVIDSQGLFKFFNANGELQSVNVKKGEKMNIDLTGRINEKDKQYEIVIPGGIVMNADGDWNPEQKVASFFYGDPIEASLEYTPGETIAKIYWNIDGYVYTENKSLTITAEGQDPIEVKRLGLGGTGGWYDSSTYQYAEINLWSLPLVDGTKYTLNIPEGAFYLDADDIDPTSPAQTLTFTFSDFIIDYMDAAEVTQTMTGETETLVPIQLTWGQEVSIGVNTYSAIIKNITDGTEEVITSQGLFRFFNANGELQSVNVKKGEKMNIDLTGKITAKDKEYEISIPAGIVVNEEGAWNPEQVLATFYYGTRPSAPEAVLDYEPGGTSMILKWTNFTDQLGAMYYGGNLTFTAGDETFVAKYSANFTEYEDENEEYNGVEFKIETLDLTDDTEYTLSIPADFVIFYNEEDYLDGNAAQEITFTYKAPVYDYMDDAEIITSMTGEVDAIVPIVISWGEHVSRSLNQYSCIIRNLTDGTETVVTSQGRFKFLNEEGEIITNAFDGETFQIDLTPNIEDKDCEYQIVIPARIVINDEGEYNPEQVIAEFTYVSELNGIDAIEYDVTDGARYFTLQGFEVTKLTPGTIYIKVVGNKSYRVLVK